MLQQMSGKPECTRTSNFTPLEVPWPRIHIDYAEPYKGEMFLAVMDTYSRWLEVHIMKSIKSAATIEKLREMFATHGLPATLVSDNGSNFTSSEFQEFMKRNGIKHIKLAPYHPASNALAERAMQIFKEAMRKWRVEVTKQSYHYSSLGSAPPLIVRPEFH